MTSRLSRAGTVPVSPSEGRGFRFPVPPLAAGLLLALSACGAPDRAARTPAQVVDDAGHAVALGGPPRRVVSLSPAATELMLALGAAPRLVARTAYDTDPRLAALPSLGWTLRPTAETVVGLRPDLVVAGPDEPGYRLSERLAAAGIPVYIADVQTISGIRSSARRLGTLLGAEPRADSLVRALDAGLAALARRVAPLTRPTVMYVLWPAPARTAGPRTFIDEVIAAAGGRNAFDDAPVRWPHVSLEEVIRRDPDVLVLPHGASHDVSRAALEAAPGWRRLRAFRAGRVVVVDSDLFSRPGPRVLDAARTLAAALHPELRDARGAAR